MQIIMQLVLLQSLQAPQDAYYTGGWKNVRGLTVQHQPGPDIWPETVV